MSGRITRNADYAQMHLNSIPAPELVTLEISREKLEPYIEGIRELAIHDPEFIVMVCNTIHLYRDHIMMESGFDNILSLREIVKEQLVGAEEPFCVLGTPLTVSSGLYHFTDRKYANPRGLDLEEIGNIVRHYNATGDTALNKARLLAVVETQKKLGAKTFLAACTEVSELLHGTEDLQLVDTLEALINHVLKKLT